MHSASVTIETWFKFPAATQTFRNLIGKPFTQGADSDTCDTWQIFYDQGELKGTVAACNTAMEYRWSPAPASWHHVALTFDAASRIEALYLDGVLVASQTRLVTLVYDANPILIGVDDDHAALAGFFAGSLADVRLWSTARTQAEIQQDMVACVSGTEANLVAAWPLDDGSGQIARDLGPWQMDATLGESAAADAHDPQWSTDAPP